jgi:hypothetical protein
MRTSLSCFSCFSARLSSSTALSSSALTRVRSARIVGRKTLVNASRSAAVMFGFSVLQARQTSRFAELKAPQEGHRQSCFTARSPGTCEPASHESYRDARCRRPTSCTVLRCLPCSVDRKHARSLSKRSLTTPSLTPKHGREFKRCDWTGRKSVKTGNDYHRRFADWTFKHCSPPISSACPSQHRSPVSCEPNRCAPVVTSVGPGTSGDVGA